MELTAKERVANGVAWLDEHVGPEWVDRVVLDEFDITMECRCVLGFVYRAEAENSEEDDRYGYAWSQFFDSDSSHVPLSVVELGFNHNGDDGDFSLLQSEWTAVIAERQAQRAVTP